MNKHLDMDGCKFTQSKPADISTLLRPGDFLFTLDLEAAYHHMQLAPAAWKYMGFRWKDSLYVSTVLHFGLASAPWVFTKITRPVVEYVQLAGQRLSSYLEDFLGGTQPDQSDAAVDFAIATLLALGWALAMHKLDRTRTCEATFTCLVY